MSLLVDPPSVDAGDADACWVEASTPSTGIVLVRISGEIDLCTIGLVDRALRTALRSRPAHLLVDLADTRFCGLRGLALLTAARAAATALGVGFAVCGASARTVRIWAMLWEPAERPTVHPDIAAGCAAASAGLAGSAGEAAVQHGVAELPRRVDVPEQGLGVG